MEATILYPHQLFTHHPGLKLGRIVYLVEEPLFFTHNPAHVQKLLLHRLSMQQYKTTLETTGYEVRYLSISELTSSAAVFDRIHRDGYTTLHIVDTTDDYLEREISLQKKPTVFSATGTTLLSFYSVKMRRVPDIKSLAALWQSSTSSFVSIKIS